MASSTGTHHQVEVPQDLSILSLSNNLLQPSDDKRVSSSSIASDTAAASPALLSADLQHYQELFSKLRFSYVEQVTKERFLRAITSNPPEFVDPSETAELEALLVTEKAALSERKQEARDMIKELGEQGESLAARYERIQLRTAQLDSLPAEIEALESTIATLQAAQQARPSNPALSLPLQPTLVLLSEREEQLAELDRQIEQTRSAMVARKQEAEQLQDDLAPLQMRKISAINEAKEARKARKNGGLGGDLEERGRWLRSVETGLRTMLEV